MPSLVSYVRARFWKPRWGGLFIVTNDLNYSFCFSAARRFAKIVPSGTPARDEICVRNGTLLRAAEKQKEEDGVAFPAINRPPRGFHAADCTGLTKMWVMISPKGDRGIFLRRRKWRSPGGFSRTLASLPWLVSGCSRAPSFDIVGSFFPAWLICLVIGILLAALARWLLLRQQIAVVWPILVYPSLAALFTFLFWLIFFS